ncbi:DUF6526 family protein [Granulicella cerasi]|uniref:DUF6526 family protein n=1 Tax=Granulicella cerasi TaxID=741063 RepID=A0ABW1ZBU3_9BACT|nr:DUF6526 family protein [Granulicella cerasi]
MEQQNYSNHVRRDIPFMAAALIFLLNIGAVSVWYWHHRWQHAHSGPWAIVVAVALLVLVMKVRTYTLTVQDRVIRLEEQLRLTQLCTPSEMVELESLTVKQLVALRFASNAELPELARRAVREKMEPKAIKEAIKSWRADHQRV